MGKGKLKFKKEVVSNLSDEGSNQVRGGEETALGWVTCMDGCSSQVVCCSNRVCPSEGGSCFCDPGQTGGWASAATACCGEPTYVVCTFACC